MRTTIAIDDELLAVAKHRAMTQGLTLGQLIENALRAELSKPRGRGFARRPRVPTYQGNGGVRPGVDTTSNRALLEALDEGRPLERSR